MNRNRMNAMAMNRCLSCAPPASALAGVGVLDPGRTAVVVGASSVGWALLPGLIGGVLWVAKKKDAAKTAFVIAGIMGAIGVSAGMVAATEFDKANIGM